jgi:ApaG protein
MPTSTAIQPVAAPAAHGIRVTVVPAFAAEHSDTDAGKFVFAYTITIANDGDAAARLVSRHWAIIDGDGKRDDVRGPGVVGQTPRVEPGGSYQYQSFCPLDTRWGTMEGTYHMRRDDGTEFDVEIPRFVLHMD